jgi:hypothetical protein
MPDLKIKFPCNICNKFYASRSSLSHHKKNIHGKNVALNVALCSQNVASNVASEANSEKLLKCRYCLVKYNHTSSRYRHEKVCNERNKDLTELSTTIINSTNITNSNNTTNTTNFNNTTNTTNNIINKNKFNTNIIINGFGKEDILKLDKKEVKKIFNNEFGAINLLVDYLYFNDRLPENHSFCTTNLQSKFASKYNPDTQNIEKRTKDYVFNQVLLFAIKHFEDLYKHHSSKLSIRRQNRVLNNIQRFKDIQFVFGKNNPKENILASIHLSSYNHKERILNTWKGIDETKEELENDNLISVDSDVTLNSENISSSSSSSSNE